jgi:enoyl-CoA hydratase/carnithine racemase
VFQFSEVKLGLIPAAISPYVVEAIGVRQARRYFLTAEKIDAHTAEKIGLVTEVCEDKKAMQILANKSVHPSDTISFCDHHHHQHHHGKRLADQLRLAAPRAVAVRNNKTRYIELLM